MFDFSSGELLLIAVAALVFIKPKDLPSVLRAVGQWTGKIRRMAGEFQDQFREAMREADMADLKKDIDEAAGKAGGLDPFGDIKDPFSDIKESVEWKPPEPTSPPAADAPPAPPAEAVMAETASAETAASPAPHADAPQPEAPKPDVVQGDIAPAAPGGDRVA
jgi:sec-independent protein translocase protein TatB